MYRDKDERIQREKYVVTNNGLTQVELPFCLISSASVEETTLLTTLYDSLHLLQTKNKVVLRQVVHRRICKSDLGIRSQDWPPK